MECYQHKMKVNLAAQTFSRSVAGAAAELQKHSPGGCTVDIPPSNCHLWDPLFLPCSKGLGNGWISYDLTSPKLLSTCTTCAMQDWRRAGQNCNRSPGDELTLWLVLVASLVNLSEPCFEF